MTATNNTHTKSELIYLRFSLFLALLAIFGSLAYYFYFLNTITLLTSALIALGVDYAITKKIRPILYSSSNKPKITNKEIAALIVIIIGNFAWWQQILSHSITEPIRSPWQEINPFSIAALMLAIFANILLLQRKLNKLSITSFAFTFFSAISLAAAAYPLGYGFDPFVHRATMKHIAEFGTITPKPLYYIGEYSLELFLNIILPLKFIDIWLTPVLAAILIIGAITVAIKHLQQLTPLALLVLFLLPLINFINTTPQSLSYIFLIATLFISLPLWLENNTYPPKSIPIILMLAAIVIHPLAGIPALFYLAALFTKKYKLINIFVYITAAIALPAVFYLQSKITGLDIELSLSNLSASAIKPSIFFGNHFSAWLDGVYLFIDNNLILLFLLALVGYSQVKKTNLKYLLIFPFIWLINYTILISIFRFDFLISYEQNNYAERLITITAIFLLPLAAIGISIIGQKLKKSNFAFISFLTLCVLAAGASIYGAYPRHDNYARSAGFNVGLNDISAVHMIENYADGQDYIVLSNQALAAAALQEFGFKKYYKNNIFYYPIPTGGQLYQYYLKMAENYPSTETMLQAMDLAGVNLGFFAINDYWWQSETIIENAKKEADDWFAVGNGAITIFIWQKQN
ncbi:hypothetical protein D6827_02220 [Candidatus Parcubacteria bacterium]|nr:MAG: hypothetical protein D6827_02220 [Candidatus Parcubacteria bacterium]